MGRSRPSIRDVAREAGVSVGTVSNVLNRPESVADDTRARVREAIEQIGYVRNESARQLRAGHSRTIGLVVLDVSNPFFTDVARGVEELADEHDLVVGMRNSGDDAEREQRHLEVLLEQRVRGLLITPIAEETPALDRFAQQGIPVVLLDRGAGTHEMCSVAVDDERGGELVGDHLCEQGHDRVAFMGGPLSIPQVGHRLEGLRRSLRRNGSTTDVTVVETSALHIANGRDATGRLLGGDGDPPTAVFCANDLIALGVLQETVRRGLRVPDDLAIVGYDDIVYAGGAAVPISSVRQPREELGRAATRLLLEEIDDAHRHEHRQVVFVPELVPRASSTGRVEARGPDAGV